MKESYNKEILEYVCTIIEYISRINFSKRSNIVKSLGIKGLNELYNGFDAWICYPYQSVSFMFIDKYEILHGAYDFNERCDERPLTSMDFGNVFADIIINMSEKRNIDIIQTTYEVYINEEFEIYLEAANMYDLKYNKLYRLELYNNSLINKFKRNNNYFIRKVNKKDYAIKNY